MPIITKKSHNSPQGETSGRRHRKIYRKLSMILETGFDHPAAQTLKYKKRKSDKNLTVAILLLESFRHFNGMNGIF